MTRQKGVKASFLNLAVSLFLMMFGSGAFALDNSTVPETVPVDSGSFFMGQNMFGKPAGDISPFARTAGSASADAFTGATPFKEGPAHRVYVSAFEIGKYVVTNQQYAQFIDAGGYDNQTYWLIDAAYHEDATSGWDWKEEEGRTCPRFIADYSTFEESGWNLSDTPYYKNCRYSSQDNTPALGVSWHEAYAYCNWLSSVTGERYRLPTEAEWEYAARGPESLIFPWGNEYLTGEEMCGPPGSGAKANCYYELDNGTFHKETEPVGSYPEGISPFGAYDMAGNVAERTADWFQFGHYYSRIRQGDVINPTGPSEAVAPFGFPIFPFWMEPCRVIKSKGFNTDPMSNGNYNSYGSSYPLRSAGKMFNVQYGGHYFIGFRVAKDID